MFHLLLLLLLFFSILSFFFFIGRFPKVAHCAISHVYWVLVAVVFVVTIIIVVAEEQLDGPLRRSDNHTSFSVSFSLPPSVSLARSLPHFEVWLGNYFGILLKFRVNYVTWHFDRTQHSVAATRTNSMATNHSRYTFIIFIIFII